MSWLDQARARIRLVDREIPTDATLAQRRKALRAAGPLFHGGTYWGRKQWGKAVREYLEGHGLPKRVVESSKDPRLLAAMERGDITFPYREAQQ